jgi:hypothetical protein
MAYDVEVTRLDAIGRRSGVAWLETWLEVGVTIHNTDL